jgi:hypothetical protein
MTQTLDHTAAIDSEATQKDAVQGAGPACPNCQAVGVDTTQTWCRRCGYYAVLGKCVELAPWEREVDADAAASAPPAKPAGAMASALKAAPAWAWGILGVVAAIPAVSLLSLVIPSDGLARSIWGGGQFLIGLFAFMVAHGLAFVYATSQLDCGILDIVMRPFSIWAPIVRQLPNRLWQVYAAVGGLTAAICACLIVGVPYQFLFDGSVSERAKGNLARAVRQAQAKTEETAPATLPAAEEKKPEETFETAECVVIGYVPSSTDAGDFSSLVVATITEGELKVVGRVREGFDDAAREKLRRKLAGIHRATPFLPCRERATWVEPRVVVRVRYSGWTKSNTLKDPRFESLLLGI